MRQRLNIYLIFFAIVSCLNCAAANPNTVTEAECKIPLAYDVDVLVLGGSLAGVEAASTASREGASVLLIESRPYLGYDLCAYQRLWLEEGEKPGTSITSQIFGAGTVTTPGNVKRALDKALLESRVQFLTGCYAVDVLFSDGIPAGAVMVNRSGRQAIRAKVIIDATESAAMTRIAGASFTKGKKGKQDYRYVVVGGKKVASLQCRELPVKYVSISGKKKRKACPVYEYTIQADAVGDDEIALKRIFNDARSATWAKGILDSSEMLFYVPSDYIVSEQQVSGDWPGADKVPLGIFRPAGVKSWYVLNARAGLAREHMYSALRPAASAVIGKRIGSEAAAEAEEIAKTGRLNVKRSKGKPGDTVLREYQNLMRFYDRPMIELGTRDLPVLGKYNVIVVGGGTAGAPAGIAAARNGAKTLVIEYLDELGGVGTSGLIGKYWYGLNIGFSKEIRTSFQEKWDVVGKAEWLRREIVKEDGDVWFGCFGCGVVMQGNKVSGVVVAGPFGRGIVLADTVIDGTGNADIAAAAGANTHYSISNYGDLSVQVAGYPQRALGDGYNNTAYAMVDDNDIFDRWNFLLHGRQNKFPDGYDYGQLIDTRDRRRVVGDYVFQTTDILTSRRFPDTIVHHKSNFDAGAFPDTPMLLVKDMKGPAYSCDMPYRCLLPKGIEGMLAIGLSVSSERDAMTLIRMQADLENQGYAAGVAAAMASEKEGYVRQVNIKALQKKLVEKGIVQERVLSDKDSHPVSEEKLKTAIAELKDLDIKINQDRKSQNHTFSALAIVMSHKEGAVPLLSDAYKGSTDESIKLKYALVLGVMGDDTGIDTLLKAIRKHNGWGPGYGFTSHRETHNTFTEIDRLVMAAGFSGSKKAVPVLVKKLKELDGTSELSHIKAICTALRGRKDSSVIEPLAELLDKPNISGHSKPFLYYRFSEENKGPIVIPPRAETSRISKNLLNDKFRELLLSGLLYECGDKDDKARATLESYTKDIHGHFARYAHQLLK